MKQFLILPLLIFIAAGPLFSQSFDEALELFEEQNFSKAAEIFSQSNDDQSVLFTGKSYFSLQNYTKANEYLRQVIQHTDDASIRQEARYTLALSYFRMKNHSQSLDLLFELINEGDRSRIRVDSRRIYGQITQYLSVDERISVLKNSRYIDVARDVVESSYNTVTDIQYNLLVDGLLNRVTDESELQQLEQEIRRPSRSGSVQTTYPEPPVGMVYNIGVLLPAVENGNPDDMLIPRNLYFGITMAAEEFNAQHPDKKIYLQYQNSHRDPDSTAYAFQNLILNHHVDAVIGPLFSEPAKRMALLAEKYKVPMIAPLANSDEINIGYNYTYQMNPTFEVHGKAMARHAVESLRLDTLAVIAQKNALGTASARSFRREAENLGAFISYYIEEDFSQYGYDLTEFTEVFSTDTVDIKENNLIDTEGIYAPFTGQAANTLINLLLTDLEVYQNDMVVMGSEEWETTSISNWQDRNFEIYFTKAFGQSADSATVDFMEQDYETRFGVEPDRFSMIGFDVGTFLFQNLHKAGNPVYLGEAIKNSEEYHGLELSISLNNNRINQHLFIRPLSRLATERLE